MKQAVFVLLMVCSMVLCQDTTTLRDYLLYSYAAYCPETDLKNDYGCYWCKMVTNKMNVTATVYSSVSNTYGYLGFSGDTAFVSFRGTVTGSIENWISDLQIAKSTLYPGISNAKVHTGFLKAYNNIRILLKTKLNDILTKHNIAKIKFMGHSLGGALATLAAVDTKLTFNLPKNYALELWTYGCPRVGNSNFYQFAAKNILTSFRTVNQNDIVAHLPPRVLSFHHLPREVYFEKNEANWVLCDTSGEDPKCANSKLLPVSVHDHLNYFGYWQRDGYNFGCYGENINFFDLSPTSPYFDK